MVRVGVRLLLVSLALVWSCQQQSVDSEPAVPESEAVVEPDSAPPNIVFIIGDDVGYPYHGFMGDPVVRTPNLDRLAQGGTVFTTGYLSASVCLPSLRSLLSGEEAFPRKPGGKRNPAPVAERSLPARLAPQGYASFQAGKFWHSSFDFAGFDEGTKSDPGGHAMAQWMGGELGLEIGRKTMQPVFDFISRHRDQPFFLWFAPILPHLPWDAPKRFRLPYRKQAPPLAASTVRYYGNISWFDEVVGELVGYLEEAGLRSRTLIVYLSDNGYGPRPDDGLAVADWRGAKGTTSELGFRTPIVFNWPGHVPAGVVRDDLVSSLDVFPTVLGYASASPPEGLPGVDLRPTLNGGPGPRSEVIGRVEGVRVLDPQNLPPGDKGSAYFLRNDRWHYVWAPTRGTELLFDIVADPEERTNVAADHPETREELRARVEQWRDDPK